jgi:hypothetical protein
MYDCPYGSTESATGSVDHWCAGSPVEVMSPLANRPFRGILMPADVNTHGCEECVRSVGSGTCYSKVNCRPWFKLALLGGGCIYPYRFHRRGSPITPPGLVQRRELNLMAHATGLAFTGLILASITLQTSLNLLLTDCLMLAI